ncbi:hypothetical protein ALC57_16975 [Trachymyrmex cornetzi]|uniref:Uncharacterized protein n=1 Tax=Trachymyrmex cornetzi TaxID=471704 RepID=A0A151IUC3_9HYME|nr:hypothetical protein ALC57_16975 [Trachymyrmex cornetzi]
MWQCFGCTVVAVARRWRRGDMRGIRRLIKNHDSWSTTYRPSRHETRDTRKLDTLSGESARRYALIRVGSWEAPTCAGETQECTFSVLRTRPRARAHAAPRRRRGDRSLREKHARLREVRIVRHRSSVTYFRLTTVP